MQVTTFSTLYRIVRQRVELNTCCGGRSGRQIFCLFGGPLGFLFLGFILFCVKIVWIFKTFASFLTIGENFLAVLFIFFNLQVNFSSS